MAGTFSCEGQGRFHARRQGRSHARRQGRYIARGQGRFRARGHSTIDCRPRIVQKYNIDTFLFLLVAYRSWVNHTSILNNFDNVVFRIIRKFWSAFWNDIHKKHIRSYKYSNLLFSKLWLEVQTILMKFINCFTSYFDPLTTIAI